MISLKTYAVDTMNVYLGKSGVGTKPYFRTWFFKRSGSYSYSINNFNKQDNVILFDTTPYYFLVYRKSGALLFEGLRPVGCQSGSLQGSIIYYFRNGNVKRVEYWNNELEDSAIGVHDGYGPEGGWSYFRKTGSIRKKVEYGLERQECISCWSIYYKRIKRINRNGKVRRNKKIYNF